MELQRRGGAGAIHWASVAKLIARNRANGHDMANGDRGTATAMSESDDGGNRRGALIGLLVAVVMLAVGLWLAHDLTAASKMQDCLMSGRTNCNVIEPAR